MSQTEISNDAIRRIVRRNYTEHFPTSDPDELFRVLKEVALIQRQLDGAAALKVGLEAWHNETPYYDENAISHDIGIVFGAEEIYEAITGSAIDISDLPKEVYNATPEKD
jgi:hypothetical protein